MENDNIERSEKWSTAGILDRPVAVLFAGRLASNGIDHAIETEGDQFRVTVQLTDLRSALELRPDVASSPAKLPRHKISPILSIAYLCSIPVGVLIGQYFGYMFSSESKAFPVGFGLLALALVAFTANATSARRSQN